MLVSSRSFEEYRAMFALTEADLDLRVLDCPGGAASFVAGAVARGTDAVAVDPRYGPGRDALGAMVLREIAYKRADLEENASRFVWGWFSGPEDHARHRTESARTFAADLRARPERYVEGSLPRLPFADRSFDLVLSSHLLFSYGATLGEGFHRSALVELVRVADRQVRLFPVLLHTSDRRYTALDRTRAWLEGLGVATRLERVGYEFQRGGDQMLVLECADRGALPSLRDGAADVDPVRWRHLGEGRGRPGRGSDRGP